MSAAPSVPTIDVFTPPSEDHADKVCKVCKVGEGHDCCRYLTMSRGGWSCERHTDLAAVIDTRVLAGLMVARSINCDGRGAR